jgi:hypothetical protein
MIEILQKRTTTILGSHLMKSLWWEKLSPYILGTAAAGVQLYLDIPFPKVSEVASAALTLGAILTGFLATAITIILALEDLPVMSRLRETGYIKEILDYLREAIWLCFAFSIWNIVGFFVAPSAVWFSVVWMFLAIASAVAFKRFTGIMFKILVYDIRQRDQQRG